MDAHIVSPIGVIRSPFPTKEACPIQPAFAAEATGRVEVFDEFQDGLKDIETFSHIYLVYLFDRAGEIRLVRPTFLDDRTHGVFATRLPGRPNNIGMSVVRLVSVEAGTLVVGGIDVLDGTPLLDIKPYLPKYDLMADANAGWTADRPWRPKPPGRE